MLKYAIVSVGSALVGGLGVWAMQPPRSPEPDAHEMEARRERTGLRSRRPAPAPDAALADCKRALLQQRAELRFVREQAARVQESTLIPVHDEDGVALADPEGQSGSAAVPQDDQAGAASPGSEGHRQRMATQKVRDAVVEHLGITDEEERIVKDLVCPQRENLRGLYQDFAEGRIDVDALFQALAQERTVSGEGLRRALGKRRFLRLRRVGAIGLLAPRLCERR